MEKCVTASMLPRRLRRLRSARGGEHNITKTIRGVINIGSSAATVPTSLYVVNAVVLVPVGVCFVHRQL